MTQFSDRSLIYTLRPYQQKVVDLFREKTANKEKKLHIVAPPGSGKTIIGISLLLESQKKGVVFSPNAAIQAQWINRFYDATDVLNFTAVTETSFSTSIDKHPSYFSHTCYK